MPCKREARFRHNTIAFWLSDAEKKRVEAKIILSGMQKGEYYRAAILGQRVVVEGNRYHSARLAAVLERMYANQTSQEKSDELTAVLEELLTVWKKQE